MTVMTATDEFLLEGAERFQNDDPTGVNSVETALQVAKNPEERRLAYFALAQAYRQVGVIYLERLEDAIDHGASERMKQHYLTTANLYLKRAYERFREVGLTYHAGLVMLDMARMALAANMHRRAVRLILDANRLMRRTPLLRLSDILNVAFIGVDWMLSRLPERS